MLLCDNKMLHSRIHNQITKKQGFCSNQIDLNYHTIPVHFPFIDLDAFIVMPDHIHGIIRMMQRTRQTGSCHPFHRNRIHLFCLPYLSLHENERMLAELKGQSLFTMAVLCIT
jgi:hypothetical protein